MFKVTENNNIYLILIYITLLFVVVYESVRDFSQSTDSSNVPVTSVLRPISLHKGLTDVITSNGFALLLRSGLGHRYDS